MSDDGRREAWRVLAEAERLLGKLHEESAAFARESEGVA